MRTFMSVLIVTFLIAATSTMVFAGSYDHEVEAKNMTFAWKIDGDTLHGKMTAKTKGWVAVGFNASKKMKDANFILGYVKNGEAKITDHYGDKATGHSEDTKKGGTSDVTLVSGSEEKGYTTIEFTLPMNSSDKLDGTLSKDEDTLLLLGYGPDRDSFRVRHKFRTSMTVNLGTGATK